MHPNAGSSFLSSMFFLLFTALTTSANPVTRTIHSGSDGLVKIPLSKRFHIHSADLNSGGTKALHISKADQVRAANLKQRGHAVKTAREGGNLHRVLGQLEARAASPSVEVQNQVLDYIATVAIGSPAVDYDLLIDTGSSNTWVGAGKKFTMTSTTQETGDKVSVTYGSGAFSGIEVLDQVSLGSNLISTPQSIGVASESIGFDGVDGILGIGPADLTAGTLFPDQSKTVPTVIDTLFSQSTISAHQFAISFQPVNGDANGELTFGGTDGSKFNGTIKFVPITNTAPANEFWGLDQSVSYGNTQILATTAGVVDTGTTLILLATDAFEKYQHLTGSVLDNNTGLLKLSTSQFGNLSSLNFHINGTSFQLTPNAQAWPRNLNTAILGDPNLVYLIVGDLGSPSGEGLDFVNGFAFLERFYSVFDTANKQIGIAETPMTFATSN